MTSPRRWCSVLALVGVLLPSFPAAAQAPDVPIGVQGAMQRLRASDPRPWEIAWDREHGQVESVTGRWRGASKDPDAAAREFLRSYADLFELQPDLADLSVGERRESLGGIHLVFRQAWNGLPVFDGGLDVHVTRGGEVFLVHNRYARTVSLAKVGPAPSLSTQDAIDIARGAHARTVRTDKAGRPLPAPAFALASAPQLGLHRGARSLELAYRLEAGGVRYVVSAVNGAILEQTALVQSASVGGTAQVFNPNPVNKLKNTALRDQGDANYVELQAAYEVKNLKAVQQDGAQYRLIGPFVSMFNASSAFLNGACGIDGNAIAKAPPVRADPGFVYARDESGFEHANVYYHLDKSQRYLQSLGFTVLNTGIAVDAHAFSADQSYFCPAGGGYLAFGDGGVDDGEDADVVLHEYGHAIQHYSSGGRYSGNGQTGAMGEGFGDYWAFSAKPTGFKPTCFSEWDANGGCLRRLDTNKRFPKQYVGQVHADGEIWSQALREIFLRLGKEKADTLVLESHFLIATSPTFSKGAKALLDADDLLYEGQYKNDLCAVLVDRGITTPGCNLWIRLSWSDTVNDVDLHLRHPEGYEYTGYDYENDCAYYNTHPDWGVAEDSTDDPLLFEECVSGCAVEKIVVNRLTEPGLYAVVVHFFSAPDFPATTTATVELYQGSKRVYAVNQVIGNTDGTALTGDVWFPVDIEVGEAKALRVHAAGAVRRGASARPVPAK